MRRFLYVNAWPIVIGLGLSLRVLGLFSARPLWLDESMLYQNLVDAPVLQVWGPLKQEQVVPPAFLMTIRAIHATFGLAVIALRVPAFLAGTTAFVLFAAWSRKSLPRPVGWIAAWLMATNADALYYCQEMKPYAFDLLSAVVLTILMDRRIRILEEPEWPARAEGLARWLRLTAAFVCLIPWFSIGAFFPCAAFFAILLFRDRHDRQAIMRVAPITIAWGISFLVTWSIEKSQVVRGSVLWNFWDFAFLKPHRPVDTLCVLADNLINPLHIATTIDTPWVMFPWVIALTAVMLFGIFRSAIRMPGLTAFGTLSAALIATASLAKAYPFHGRTILVLLPFALIFFSFGIARLSIRPPQLHRAFLILALIAPSISALHIRPFSGNRLISFDGDLEHDHFTRRYGVVKRANMPPARLTPSK